MKQASRRRLYPTYYAADITSVTPDFVRQCGCTAVLADIDNTLAHVDAPDAVPAAAAWMRALKDAGIRLAFLSNNDPPRVEPFAAKYGADFFCHAQKPMPDGYLALAKRFGCRPEECLVVGDQLFTDILGGNHAGMPTVIVTPICEEEDPKPFRKRRKAEKLLLRLDLARKNRGVPR